MNFASVILSKMASVMSAIIAEAKPDIAPSEVSIEFSVWKYVVIISGAAFVIFFLIKRFADIAAKQKTATMIRDVVGEEEAKSAEEWVDPDDD